MWEYQVGRLCVKFLKPDYWRRGNKLVRVGWDKT